MPGCAVAKCGNFNKKTKGTGIKYFRFPKTDEFAKKWIAACRREDAINLKNACVCSEHFEASGFEIPLIEKLLNYTCKNSRHLKADAVPTLKLPVYNVEKTDKREIQQRSDQVSVTLKTAICESVVVNPNNIEVGNAETNVEIDHTCHGKGELRVQDIMNSDSSDEEYNPGKDNRTARKSTMATPPTYSTRRQAARNASKAISASSFDKSMEKFNPDMSQREKRKLKKFNQSTVRKPNGAVYDEKGRHVSGVDLCDCLNEKCPGCWFECPKCDSNKCGTECRVFRKYIVDSIEYHGYDKTVRNNLALRN